MNHQAINIFALAVHFLSASPVTVCAQTSTTLPETCLPVATVETFNLTEYTTAPWYVQQQAVNAYTPLEQNRCVTAQYEIRDDSGKHWWERNLWGYTVDVFNYAESNSTSSSSSGGSLCADFDEDTPSKLTVAPCFLPQWLGGPYWMISYREEEAENSYALVSGGAPRYLVEGETNCGVNGTDACCKTGDGINRSGLWILTRERNPSESLVNEVRDIANRMGFSTSGLFDVTHDSDCQVPGIDDKDEVESNNNSRLLRHENH